MSKIFEWNEESERLEVESSLQYLKKFLDEREDLYEISKYVIGEYFPKETDDPFTYFPKAYGLTNLKIDTIENGIILFNDAEGILEGMMYDNTPLKLHMFCQDSLIYLGFQNGLNKITLSFDSGYIQIYY